MGIKRSVLISIFILLASALSASCQSKEEVEARPSGLKNMAPPPLSQTVYEELDVEPNDTMLQASVITLTGDTLHFTGHLENGDVDTWRIKAKAGTVVDMEIVPESFDIIADFSPTDRENGRRYYDDAAAGKAEYLTNIRLTPQGGFLTLRGRNESRAAYTVSITRVQSDEDGLIEQEPNDAVTSAQLVWLGREYRGTLNPRGDVDFLKINLTIPGKLVCDFGRQSVAVSLHQANREIMRQEVKAGELLEVPQVEAADNLYARIEAVGVTDGVVRYTCRLEAAQGSEDESEPNDSPLQAQRLTGEFRDLELTFSSATDVDYFRVTLPQGGGKRYTAQIEAGSQVMPALEVLGANGQPLATGNGGRVCLFEAGSGGEFLLRAAHAPSTQKYPLPYRLSLESYDAETTEREPDNSASQANALPVGQSKRGFIFPENDVDYWRMDIAPVPGSSIGHLEVTTGAGYVSSIAIRLEDGDGFEIARAESQHASRPAMLSSDIPAGTYYVVVSGTGDGCAKPYSVFASYEPVMEPTEAETGTAAGEASNALEALQNAVGGQVDAPATVPNVPESVVREAATSGTATPSTVAIPAAQASPSAAPLEQAVPADIDIGSLLDAAATGRSAVPVDAVPAKKTDDEDAF